MNQWTVPLELNGGIEYWNDLKNRKLLSSVLHEIYNHQFVANSQQNAWKYPFLGVANPTVTGFYKFYGGGEALSMNGRSPL